MTQVTARMRQCHRPPPCEAWGPLEPRGFFECLLEWPEHFSDTNGQEL